MNNDPDFGPILVVVHPGSLCGSANHSLGRFVARGVRDEIAHLLREWTGPVVVVDSEFSDELGFYPNLSESLADAVTTGGAAGLGVRLYADDPVHGQALVRLFAELGVPSGANVAVTGAWYDPSGQSGCVNLAVQSLQEAGYNNCSVHGSAAEIEVYGLSDEDEDAPDQMPSPRFKMS
jgi:hypothetical protein